MAEVYRARDPRLGRDVAIKVSSHQFSDRFEREARAVAALNHPHICQIYDVGPDYLVMELIEGSPLKGPLPLADTLKYASQICDALDAAHSKGITHRDLKPANILVTKTGVKLLDFGLAKLQPEAATVTASLPGDATRTMGLTGRNEIVGTLYYMSPEQLQAQSDGQEVGARSDIFSFGLVLYEMLTGKRAFEGSSPASVIAAIMERPAPSIADVAPPALDRLLQRCLKKEPDDRWQTVRDLKSELDWIASAAGEAAVPAAITRRRTLPWIAAVVLGVTTVAASWIAYRATRPADLKPLVRLDVDLGPDVALGSFAGPNAILSPDGSRLVYVSHNRLFTRGLDQQPATELSGTDGANAPFFSPDGQWVAFFAGSKLKKVSVAGGAANILCNAPLGVGGSWGEDGTIIAALNIVGGLFRISADGRAPAPLTKLDRERGEVTHRWPQILPRDKAVLFTAHTRNVGSFDDATIEVISLADRRKKTLLRGGAYGRYVPSGHLIYVNRGTLFAVPFDLAELEVHGSPTPVLYQVAYSINTGTTGFEASQTGTLVYESGDTRGGAVAVQWLESNGKTRVLLPKPANYGRPSLSPDGRRLAVEVSDGPSQDIWVYGLARDTMTRLTFDGIVNQSPIWSPDGRYIVFGDREGISWTRADGVGRPQSLVRTKTPNTFPWSFTSDGKRLAYNVVGNPETGYDLWTVPLETDGAGLRAGKPEVYLQTPFDKRNPSFSPDGRWLAYTSNELGSFQVYVQAFPDKGGKWQISRDGGGYPMWSHSGRELFFESLDNRIMVAGYTVQGDSFMPDTPRLWSEKALANTVNSRKNVDLAPDGKRIVAVMPADVGDAQQSRSHIVFLENFLDELRRRVPVSGK
jgi:serine/threonine-protein kinase